MPNPNENIDDDTERCEQCGSWLCDCGEDELYEDELERTYDGGEA